MPHPHICFIKSGSHLLSHAVSSIVPSAAEALTFVFGMGTGVSPPRIATRYPVLPFFRMSPCFPDNPTVKQPLLLPYKGGDPAAPSDTATLLRLHPSYQTCLRLLLPANVFALVRSQTSGISDSHGVTGGVYKTRERIHRSILICDY